MNKQLRPLKTDEDLAAIPLDQPVLVELPSAMASFEGDGGNVNDNDAGKDRKDDADDGAKRLQSDLEALKAQSEANARRADQADRDRAEAVRVAAEREEENKRLRQRSVDDEDALITNGLTGAQASRDSAKAEFERAFEAGDPKAMADAQSKIGRAEAKILQFESGAAELAERKETTKREPERRVEPVRADFAANVQANPNLLQTEKDWMIRHKDSFNDPDFNKKLDTAYMGAMNQAGLVRGTPEYFEFIEIKSGLKKPEQRQDNNDDERDVSVSAPPSRNERGGDGRPLNNRVTLTPEERDMARSLGVSDIDYARQKVALDVARKADPEKYR